MGGDVDARAHNRAGDILNQSQWWVFSSGDFQIESRSQPATGYLVGGWIFEQKTNPSEKKMLIKLEIFQIGLRNKQ